MRAAEPNSGDGGIRTHARFLPSEGHGGDVRSETPCPTCGHAAPTVYDARAQAIYGLQAEVERLRALVQEARSMVPHADEPSDRRNDWCARADAALESALRGSAPGTEPTTTTPSAPSRTHDAHPETHR